MSRNSRWPVRVKRGNSTVTLYKADRKKNGHTYREFKLAYYNEIGKRTLQSFNSFKKAHKAADNVNVSLMKGCKRYGDTPELLILADSGGSNSARCRLWKYALQEKLVDPYQLNVTVCHYPPVPPSGIRSNTDSSVKSANTGPVSPWSIIRRSFDSLAKLAPKPAYESTAI